MCGLFWVWWRRRALPPASERAPDRTSTSVSYNLVLARTTACRRASAWASPEKFLAPRVRDSLGRNSPLNDATTRQRGAYRSEERNCGISAAALLKQLQRNRCWQLMPCGQFYEATAPRLAILNDTSPVESGSPPYGYMRSPVWPAVSPQVGISRRRGPCRAWHGRSPAWCRGQQRHRACRIPFCHGPDLAGP